MNPEERIVALLDLFERRYGRFVWWDAPTDEVIIGAVLTQQTRWENVERALDNLRKEGICSPEGIAAAEIAAIEDHIRSTGFYRVKTRRLKAICRKVQDAGGVGALAEMPTADLRAMLLGVNGVGEETADSILCYGFGRASFVIDAYTRRICGCMGISGSYRELKELFERVLSGDAAAHARAHGWIVEYAKEFCGKKRCEECRIRILQGSA
ncbi:MAG: endonuclease related protein [Methanofollis sp.]|nr:endonuclease related protein [Methanofollis sp.]